MAEQTRNSVLAIMEEVDEGTPVKPTVPTDFVALQDGADMAANIEPLENAELKASLGKSKAILGLESPTFTMSHYLRHSGVEGQAPDYNLFLKAAFGNEVIEAAEFNTIVGSTVSAVNVDAGEGPEYERGQALLVKDPVNGYSIRPIKSVAGDVLTPGFNLPVAPGIGVDLGKSVTYTPANADHITLSIWHYLSNAGAIELMAGSRVTELGIEFAAGQLINMSMSCEGIQYYWNPIVIDATNKFMDFDDGGGEENVFVAEKTYKDPTDLAAALQTAMDGATADNITVVYDSDTGKFVTTSDGGTFELLWKTGVKGSDNTDTHIGTLLGFDDAADDTGALTYTSDTAQDWSAPATPSTDDSDPLAAKNNSALIGDADDNTCFEASTVSVAMGTPKTDINSVCAETGKSGSVITERTNTVTITALLERHESERFRKFRQNEETSFMYAFGPKVGGNWVAGKSGCLYLPTCTITSYDAVDQDGLLAVTIILTAFVNADNEGEVYLSFV